MKCTALVLLVASLAATARADVELTRTFSDVTAGKLDLTFKGAACASHDAYGDNDCTVDWGTKLAIGVNATLNQDITPGASVDVDLKVDGHVLPTIFPQAPHYSAQLLITQGVQILMAFV